MPSKINIEELQMNFETELERTFADLEKRGYAMNEPVLDHPHCAEELSEHFRTLGPAYIQVYKPLFTKENSYRLPSTKS